LELLQHKIIRAVFQSIILLLPVVVAVLDFNLTAVVAVVAVLVDFLHLQ
jgi:hypothetical protein